MIQRAIRWALGIGRRFVARYTFDQGDLGSTDKVLWSKGIARLCDVAGPESYWRAPTEMVHDRAFFERHYANAHGLVWVRLGTGSRHGRRNDLDEFVSGALPRIQRPFVLLTTDGDASVPSDLCQETVTALLRSPLLVAWYSQNCDGTVGEAIQPFPIGLDLHTPRPFLSPRRLLRSLDAIAQSARPLDERPVRIYCDLNLGQHALVRREAVSLLQHTPHVVMPRRRTSQIETWNAYAASPFVLSLAGNGLDCHRTWEALYLGSAVIALRSSLDRLYEGLPVILIDDLRELLDRPMLSEWRNRVVGITTRDDIRTKLSAHAWLSNLRPKP